MIAASSQRLTTLGANMGDELSINQGVLAYARSNRGKLVGRSECWDLPERALASTKKAQTSTDIMGDINLDDDKVDYVWGDLIQVKDIVPGDIIQFRDYVILIKTETKYLRSDVQPYWFGRPLRRPHHSAIALTKLDKDGVVSVLEQWHKHPVQEGKIYTQDIVFESDGSEDYNNNKIPPGQKYDTIRQFLKKAGATKFHRTITITTSGTYWVYHPKKK
jgi:hypothetical protein